MDLKDLRRKIYSHTRTAGVPPTIAGLSETLGLDEKTVRSGLTDLAAGRIVVLQPGSGELLMVAHMNAEALRLTIDTGEVHYYSRSRKALWKKGETSGEMQKLIRLATDCDFDNDIDVVRRVLADGNGVYAHAKSPLRPTSRLRRRPAPPFRCHMRRAPRQQSQTRAGSRRRSRARG